MYCKTLASKDQARGITGSLVVQVGRSRESFCSYGEEEVGWEMKTASWARYGWQKQQPHPQVTLFLLQS